MTVNIFNTENKYGVIYADPPWLYNDTLSGLSRMGATPYPCMKQEDINRLPVPDIAAKDCVLFLWVTMPKPPEGLETIKAWGVQI